MQKEAYFIKLIIIFQSHVSGIWSFIKRMIEGDAFGSHFSGVELWKRIIFAFKEKILIWVVHVGFPTKMWNALNIGFFNFHEEFSKHMH